MADPSDKGEIVQRKEERGGDGRFRKGNRFGKGNPFARYQALVRSRILEQETPERVLEVIDLMRRMALVGKVDAARVYLEHTVGKPKETPTDWLEIELPAVVDAKSFSDYQRAVLSGLAQGRITLDQARELSSLGENFRKAYHEDEITEHLRSLEEELRGLTS